MVLSGAQTHLPGLPLFRLAQTRYPVPTARQQSLNADSRFTLKFNGSTYSVNPSPAQAKANASLTATTQAYQVSGFVPGQPAASLLNAQPADALDTFKQALGINAQGRLIAESAPKTAPKIPAAFEDKARQYSITEEALDTLINTPTQPNFLIPRLGLQVRTDGAGTVLGSQIAPAQGTLLGSTGELANRAEITTGAQFSVGTTGKTSPRLKPFGVFGANTLNQPARGFAAPLDAGFNGVSQTGTLLSQASQTPLYTSDISDAAARGSLNNSLTAQESSSITLGGTETLSLGATASLPANTPDFGIKSDLLTRTRPGQPQAPGVIELSQQLTRGLDGFMPALPVYISDGSKQAQAMHSPLAWRDQTQNLIQALASGHTGSNSSGNGGAFMSFQFSQQGNPEDARGKKDSQSQSERQPRKPIALYA
ncbi:MAG: hypothetical protein VKJ06_04350 [Vampirovibrionales bacterium]|nr:hypothetical protein [Vampirovibrionales bacterium]